MLRWGIIALIVALVAGFLGFTGVAGAAATFAKIVFGIGLVLFVIALFAARKVV